MGLFLEALQREVDELHRNKVRLRFIGAREQLQPELVRRIEDAEAKTAENDGLNLIVAAAYGGRWDIVQASASLARQAMARIRRNCNCIIQLDKKSWTRQVQ